VRKLVSRVRKNRVEVTNTHSVRIAQAPTVESIIPSPSEAAARKFRIHRTRLPYRSGNPEAG